MTQITLAAKTLLFLAGSCWYSISVAQASVEHFVSCAKNHPDNNAERLKCYDNAASVVQPEADALQSENDDTASATSRQLPITKRSYLTRAWNLDDMNSRDGNRLGRLKPHRQSYLVVRHSSNPNKQPSSPAIGHTTLVSTSNDLDALETKFQFSFKADIGSQADINLWGLKTMRVWGAYTQQSNWQVLNSRNSAPFRETRYEPELIATFGTDHASGLKLVNLGLVHQSNGHRLPESRSWNRIYLQGGWEWNNSTSILARGWLRIPENSLKDDNPDMTDYVGRADLVARWEPDDKSQAVSILLRNNLRLPGNRGFVQFDWSMPVALGNAARLHAQLSSGFGESLIDYNHHQNTFGLGFSFREW